MKFVKINSVGIYYSPEATFAAKITDHKEGQSVTLTDLKSPIWSVIRHSDTGPGNKITVEGEDVGSVDLTSEENLELVRTWSAWVKRPIMEVLRTRAEVDKDLAEAVRGINSKFDYPHEGIPRGWFCGYNTEFAQTVSFLLYEKTID